MAAEDRIVADLGNTRLKWAKVDPEGRLGPTEVLELEKLVPVIALGEPGQRWALSSVTPPGLDQLRERLERGGAAVDRVMASAAEVPVRHELEAPERTGADRALAVLGALGSPGRVEWPGVVVSCGTAVTIERVGAGGVWLGGAIAPGLRPAARALRRLTAQLPEVAFEPDAGLPPSFGRSTGPAMLAGLAWGLVGSVRELRARAVAELGGNAWVVWTGGDATWLAREVEGASAVVMPDLVLRGLAVAVFPAGLDP